MYRRGTLPYPIVATSGDVLYSKQEYNVENEELGVNAVHVNRFENLDNLQIRKYKGKFYEFTKKPSKILSTN